MLAFAATGCTDEDARPDEVVATMPPGAHQSTDITPVAPPEPTTTDEATSTRAAPADDHRPDPAPPPSEIEARYIDALEGIGATDVGVSEHGFREANIGATFQGRYVQVHAYPEEIPAVPGAQQIATLELDGHAAELWETGTWGESIRLECGPDRIQVSSLDADMAPGSSTREHAEPVAQALVETTCL